MKCLALLCLVLLSSVCLTSCAQAPPKSEFRDKLLNECIEDDQPHKGMDFFGVPLRISSGRFYKMNQTKVICMNSYHPYDEAYAIMRLAPEKDLEGLGTFVFALDNGVYRLYSVCIEGITPTSGIENSLPPFGKKMTPEMKSRWVAYFKSKWGEPECCKTSLKWQKEGTILEVREDNKIYLEDQALKAAQSQIREMKNQCY